MKKVVIFILCIGIVGLCGYLVWDKAINKIEETDTSKNGKVEKEDQELDEKIEEKDVTYFQQYLYYFMPSASANHFLKTIDSFSEEDINFYILSYYRDQVSHEKLEEDKNSGDYDGNITYTVSKEEVAKLVKKYFGIDNFTLKEDWGNREGIRKLNDNIYQIYWFATGWFAPKCEFTSVTYNGNDVEVIGKLSEIGETIFKENSKIVFHLVYQDGNYNVKSIQYEE